MSGLIAQLEGLRPSEQLRTQRNKEYDQELCSIVQQLSSTDAKTLLKGDEACPDLLEALDPSLDTLPFLFVLVAQIKAAANKKNAELLRPGSKLWLHMTRFLVSFNPVEVKYTGLEWRFVVETVASRAQAAQESVLALQPILTAILRLDPSGGTFTSTHLLYVSLCLEAEAFAEATPLLDCDIHALPSTPMVGMQGMSLCSEHHYLHGSMHEQYGLTGKVKVADLQEYYLLGGMIHIGLKSWRRAMFYFEMVLSTPTNGAVNALMLESYRKWILVSLMVHGSVSSSGPRTINPTSLKTLKAAAKPYLSISDAFGLTDRRKLHAELLEAQPLLAQDGNFGLVQEVYKHHQRLFVSNLQKTYATIPISNLAAKLGESIAETEAIVMFYIQDGSLNARIERGTDGSPDFLRFGEGRAEDAADSESRLRQKIVLQTDKIKRLSEHVKEADRRLSLTREFLEQTRKGRKASQQRTGSEDDGVDMYDVNFPTAENVDEDMMGDG